MSITPRQKSGSVRCSSQSAEILRVERGELRRHPRLGVHAVGDAGDRNFVNRHAGPDIFPERLTDFAVQFAHAVRIAGSCASARMVMLKAIERIDAASGRSRKSSSKGMPSSVAKFAEVTAHHLARERIVARGHRRVRGEDIRRRDNLQRGIEIEFLLDHDEANPFEREESRVAFVHVKHFRVDSSALSAFTPPMPRTISWRIRISRSPPYKFRGDQAIFRRCSPACRCRADKD